MNVQLAVCTSKDSIERPSLGVSLSPIIESINIVLANIHVWVQYQSNNSHIFDTAGSGLQLQNARKDIGKVFQSTWINTKPWTPLFLLNIVHAMPSKLNNAANCS